MTEILCALAAKAESILENAISNEEGPDRIAEIAEIAALAHAAINQQTDIINDLANLVDNKF